MCAGDNCGGHSSSPVEPHYWGTLVQAYTAAATTSGGPSASQFIQLYMHTLPWGPDAEEAETPVLEIKDHSGLQVFRICQLGTASAGRECEQGGLDPKSS